MKIRVVTEDIVNIRAGAIIVNSFERNKKLEGEIAAVDRALDGTIAELLKRGDIKGKLNEVTLVHTMGKLPAARVAVTGLGRKRELTASRVRGAMAETCRFLRQKGVETIASIPQGVGINGITPEASSQAITEGALLGLYTFRRHMTKKENGTQEINRLTITAPRRMRRPLQQGADRGRILAEAANLARDLVNEPANCMTPTRMAESAEELAESYGLETEVLDRQQIEEAGMGGLLGVAQGSQQPPKFIVLRYRGSSRTETDVALVGKGITFDSGGISIKPSEGMAEMKGDMAGGAAVMAALCAVAQFKADINVTAIVPATENLPSGSALKPGDIITAMNGKTIEVLNTDAEGRLILADGLSYARKLNAANIIDVATLTGACRIALGTICTGAFSNNQRLADRVIAAGNEAGEPIWQMPMFDEYREYLKSDIADIKNIGNRYAGAITAAKFLAEFVDGTPWVHLDIAGTSETDKDKGHLVKGATGVPVRALVGVVLGLAGRESRPRGRRRRR